MDSKRKRTTAELEALVRKVDEIKRTEQVPTLVACKQVGLGGPQYYKARGSMGKQKLQTKRAYRRQNVETIISEKPAAKDDKLMVVVGSISQVRALLAGEL